MATRARVRVIADDCGVRQRAVHPAVDPGEPRRDLVDRAMEVVDASLQRDGELDEVGAAAAEQHALRRAQPPHPHPEPRAERQRPGGRRRRSERHGQLDTHAPSEKMTGYSAELFVLFLSLGTGSTSIRIVRFSPKSTEGKSRKTTVFVSPTLIT